MSFCTLSAPIFKFDFKRLRFTGDVLFISAPEQELIEFQDHGVKVGLKVLEVNICTHV